MDKLLGIFKSRKFWAAVVALVFVCLKAYVPNFPFSEDQLLAVVLSVVAYILGVAIEDMGLRISGK